MNLLQAAAGQPQQPSPWGFYIMIALMIVVLWLFMWRPESKRRKEMQKFRENLKKGDKIITAGGIYGTVKEIKLFSTVITTTDNKRIYIPNSSISNAIVNNYSAETMRRVEWKISLAYGDDVDVAKQTMSAMIEADPRVLHAPEAPANPFVALSELADSSIVMLARVWVRTADYWDLYFDMNERFYRELPEKGLHFPFPQLDVHLDKQ